MIGTTLRLAHTYARVLFGLAEEAACLEEVREDLNLISTLMERHPDFGQVLVDLADFEPHFRALVAFVAASQITLTKPSAERTEADPFVIALALHLAGRNPRDLGTPRPAAREAVVVTDESVASSKKIPAVCRALNLPCCSLVRLLEREDYRG